MVNANSEDTGPADLQDLIWDLLDEVISEPGLARLNTALGDDKEARRLYMQRVRMHVDLQELFHGGANRSLAGSPSRPFDLPWSSSDSSVANPASRSTY